MSDQEVVAWRTSVSGDRAEKVMSGPIADTESAYDAVKRMRTVPLGKTSILPLALAAAAPMVAVIAIKLPAKSVLLGILKALI